MLEFENKEKMNVLLLDDEPGITQISEAVLKMDGYDVSKFNEPELALEDVQGNKYTVMIIDLLMPRINGFEFIEKAKQTTTNANAIYILLTASPLTDDDRRRIFELGAHLVPKPFKPRELLDTVTNLIASKQ